MFDQSAVESGGDLHGDAAVPAWLVLHRDMKSETAAQCAWDARRARHLRQAEAQQLWNHFGYISILEYLEREHGIDVRTANDRLRVSQALGELPMLEAELEDGTFKYSHVRELVRVVTPENEDEWIAAATGKTVLQVQEMVAGKQKGAGPTDPSDPDLRRRTFRIEMTPQTLAMYRELRAEIESELGHRIDDENEVMHLIFQRARDGREGASTPAQISICSHCERGWQNGSGFQAELDPAEIAAALCDADQLGSVDDESPVAKTPTISPRKRKKIIARDRHRCTAPGCRSARNLDVHHIHHREDGGGNQDWNLLTLCAGHHRMHHRGQLLIEGRAPDGIRFTWKRDAEPWKSGRANEDRAHVSTGGANGARAHVSTNAGPPPSTGFSAVAMRVQARDALVELGWKRGIARAAVEEACVFVDSRAAIETLIFESLRRCPRPSTE